MNRLDRLTAILIQLQSKRVVRAQEIADRFDISLRTVYRDVRTLEEAGIPIIGEAGVGYSIMDGYRLPPVMFTREEATAFLMAEKIIERYTDSGTSEHFKSAMFKIRSVLRSTEKDFLENVDENFVVFKNRGRTLFKNEDSLQPILQSICEKRVVAIEYQALNSETSTQREIEPIGMFLQMSCWYVIAFCRLRSDYRTFRIDRISRFEITNEIFKNAHPTLHEHLAKISHQKDLKKVIIRVEKMTAKYIETQKYYYGFLSEREVGTCMEMTFVSASLTGFAHWYLTIATHAEIVQPELLKETVREIVNGIAARF
ncbi:MAG TPA: YafY family protein [Patescibacteria group bacterium]|nr:YafY family protein [Patescibacteria group bacterium]